MQIHQHTAQNKGSSIKEARNMATHRPARSRRSPLVDLWVSGVILAICASLVHANDINPQGMCSRVMGLVLCVCLSVCPSVRLSVSSLPTGEITSVDDWPKWKRRFEHFRPASGLAEKTEEVHLSVWHGDQADDILRSFKSLGDDVTKYET